MVAEVFILYSLSQSLLKWQNVLFYRKQIEEKKEYLYLTVLQY